ncbi:DUF6202 family protein [Eleftheria terrae]|uniref:DUF6202 family protein n=1 Tax=Eleftheria terrae TaxID=1597781 RepID=UPI00263AA0E7|nr:DUF6202 family protein [Eleftheria terrae]WKB53385.1 DUF6202 family protein [Eleftheria terrae]
MTSLVPSPDGELPTLALPRSRGHAALRPDLIERRIGEFIEQAALTPNRNGFFLAARGTDAVPPVAALCIAYHWRDIARAFLLCALKGLGSMAEEASRGEPRPGLLRALQAAHAAIGDDLNNRLPAFRKAAPAGIAGIHYVWWQDSIVAPLLARCDAAERARGTAPSTAVDELLRQMQALSRSAIGVAVQLRVMELMAFDIAVAFRRVFGRVATGGRKVFAHRDDLAWIDAHLRAEAVHSRSMRDPDSGMAALADTAARQEDMLMHAAAFVKGWAAVLADFEHALSAR